jgi:hypothetical protein
VAVSISLTPCCSRNKTWRRDIGIGFILARSKCGEDTYKRVTDSLAGMLDSAQIHVACQAGPRRWRRWWHPDWPGHYRSARSFRRGHHSSRLLGHVTHRDDAERHAEHPRIRQPNNGNPRTTRHCRQLVERSRTVLGTTRRKKRFVRGASKCWSLDKTLAINARRFSPIWLIMNKVFSAFCTAARPSHFPCHHVWMSSAA